MSEQMDETRPGYAEIKLASALHPESGAWAFFMREVMRLPVAMTPAVIQVIRLESWKSASDPINRMHLRRISVRGPSQHPALFDDGTCLPQVSVALPTPAKIAPDNVEYRGALNGDTICFHGEAFTAQTPKSHPSPTLHDPREFPSPNPV
jgi:hypothetical protein